MQTVYVDVLIFTNIFQDFLYLICVKKIHNLNSKYYRLLLGSLAGGISSLVAILPTTNFIVSLIIQIVTAIILVLITFGFINKNTFIKNVFTLFILSFLVNGALIFFYLAIKPNGMIVLNDKVYFDISPLLLIILTLVIYFILIIYRKLFSNHSKSIEIAEVTINYKDNNTKVKCKIDSGCNVKEPFSGNNVIIIENKAFSEIDIPKSNMRVIPFESLGGKGIIFGFKPDSVYINNTRIHKEVYVGICHNVFKNNILGLVPTAILEDIWYDITKT